MKTIITLFCAILFSTGLSSQKITGSSQVDKLYMKIIKANGNSLQKWAEQQTEKSSIIKSAPSGKSFSKLKPVEQKILLFVVQVEEIKKLKEQISTLKIGSSSQKQKKKELAEKLKQAEILSSSTQKQIDDGGSAVIGKIG